MAELQRIGKGDIKISGKEAYEITPGCGCVGLKNGGVGFFRYGDNFEWPEGWHLVASRVFGHKGDRPAPFQELWLPAFKSRNSYRLFIGLNGFNPIPRFLQLPYIIREAAGWFYGDIWLFANSPSFVP
ncbi:MAG: hypothetical protein V1845_02125 [bacterium]